jgi:hypothetical protein
MYSLKVLKAFVHADGRIFEIGHDCKALDPFEVSELVTDYPDHFEAADDSTADFLRNADNVKHLSDAVKRKHKEQGLTGSVKVRKQ